MELKPFYRILSFGSGTYKEKLHSIMMERLEKEGYEKAVTCPEGESINQWVAIHMVFFFNDINLLYGAVQEKCTNYSCPFMSAGVNFEYLWADKYKYKNPTRVPAKTYIDYLMNWIVKLLEDERLFPQEKESIFARNYVDKIKNISKRYFRVYAHIFYSHLEVLRQYGIEKMYYDSLIYFLVFIDMFSLVPSADLRPLATLINRLVPGLKITHLLNQSEEDSRQMKMQLVSNTNPPGRSRGQSIDSNDKVSANTSRDERATRNQSPIPLSQGDGSQSRVSTADSTSMKQTMLKQGVIDSPRDVSIPSIDKGSLSSGTVTIGTNISSMGMAGISSQAMPAEEKVNWDAILRENGDHAGQPASYTGATEGEENCECTVY